MAVAADARSCVPRAALAAVLLLLAALEATVAVVVENGCVGEN